MLSLEEILLKISKYNENCNRDLITKAYNLAKLQHRGQIRASGEDYFSHPVAVAEILIDLKMDDESICTALLHDVVEDTDISILDIDDMFGSTISGMIDGVTKIGKFKFSSKKAKQAENFRKFILAVAKDIRTLIVKLADRLFGECLDDDRTILMSDTNIYINDKDEDGGSNASFYLAHEMAHALIDNMYSYNKYDYEHDTATYKFIDADADKVGGALYNLALMIYEQNEMKKFK